MRVGPTSDDELARIIAEGGRRGEIYAGLQSTPRPLRRRRSARAIPKIPRRVSGYNLDELLPENGFNVARALVGTECTCVVVLEAKCTLVYSPAEARAGAARLSDVYRRRAITSREILEFEPIGLEGLDDLPDRGG